MLTLSSCDDVDALQLRGFGFYRHRTRRGRAPIGNSACCPFGNAMCGIVVHLSIPKTLRLVLPARLLAASQLPVALLYFRTQSVERAEVEPRYVSDLHCQCGRVPPPMGKRKQGWKFSVQDPHKLQVQSGQGSNSRCERTIIIIKDATLLSDISDAGTGTIQRKYTNDDNGIFKGRAPGGNSTYYYSVCHLQINIYASSSR